MDIFKSFAKSAIASIREGVDEIIRFANGFEPSKITDSLVEFNDSIREGFEKIKSRINNLNDKFVVDVDYDRDCETLSYQIDGDSFEARVLSEPSCECGEDKVSRTVVTSIPDDVDVTTLKCKYDAEAKKMIFVFSKFGHVEETVETTATTETQEVEEKINGDNDSDVEVELVFEDTEPSFEERKLFMATEMKAMHDEGVSYRKIAKEFGVSDKTVARWIRELEA